jgi:hypothetical protein
MIVYLVTPRDSIHHLIFFELIQTLMARKKKIKEIEFHLDVALYTADGYMRMADRAVEELGMLDVFKRSGLEGDKRGPVCLAISSMAFALEIYFKSIAYIQDQKTLGGHDLVEIWKDISKQAREVIRNKFDANYSSSGTDWSILVAWNHHNGISNPARIRTLGATADDIIDGHRYAFAVERYGYEVPKPPAVKAMVYNVEGLQLICLITRELAILLAEAQRTLIEDHYSGAKATKDSSDRYTLSVKLPADGPIKKLP